MCFCLDRLFRSFLISGLVALFTQFLPIHIKKEYQNEKNFVVYLHNLCHEFC